jgi:hypothetical protein
MNHTHKLTLIPYKTYIHTLLTYHNNVHSYHTNVCSNIIHNILNHVPFIPYDHTVAVRQKVANYRNQPSQPWQALKVSNAGAAASAAAAMAQTYL